MARNTQATIRILLAAAVLVMAAAWPGAAYGQSVDEAKAAQVKAGYLANFLRFTQWPDEAFAADDAPVIVAVLEPDPLGRVLDAAVRQLKIGDRAVSVRRVVWPDRSDYPSEANYERALEQATAAVADAHLLFIGAGRGQIAGQLVERLNGAPVLTVGDGRELLASGAMLALELDRDRIVFYANTDRIKRSSISVSSRLLSLARLYES